MKGRKWFTLGLGLALLLVAVGGWLFYQRHQQVQQIGKVVYKEMDGDGLPPQAGVLDDPLFKTLPPPPTDQPVSLGRYKPPKPKASDPATPGSVPSAPKAADPKTAPKPSPTSAPAATGTQAASPDKTNSPKLAPLSFNERVKTKVKIHVLLIGNDQEDKLGSGRGDVLLLLTFDPLARVLTFLNIPRDTQVFLPGYGRHKINAAYAYGGAPLQTLTVERFLGIPMDKVVVISMGGFREAIDLVGGVDVHPTFKFEMEKNQFEPGPMHLSGVQALAYTRMRKEDPQGDLGRNARQQEVLRSLMKSLGALPPDRFRELVEQLQGDLRTDFSPSEVVNLRQAHSYMLTNQRIEKVAGVNRKISGLWYYVVSDPERQRLHLLLR